MCSICGEIDFSGATSPDALREMSSTLVHRGPDASGDFCDSCVTLCHNRLAVVDVENGAQPMTVIYGNKKYTIVYNGEIYNARELRQELEKCGIEFKTSRCQTAPSI